VVVLNLPPPTASASASVSASASASVSIQANAEISEQSAEPIVSLAGGAAALGASDLNSAASTLEPTTCSEAASMRPNNNNTCDFDSDTELSIVAAAAAAVSASSAIIVSSSRSPPTSPPASASLILPALSPSVANSAAAAAASSLSAMAGNQQQNQAGFGAGAGAGSTNGHSSNSTHLSLNAKQQRQQKRRRERAQRLQAERDSRCNSSALNGTFIAGSVGVNSSGSGNAVGAASAAQGGGLATPVGGGGSSSSVVVMGNGSGTVAGNGNGMIYHINSAGSMGEDSNNSNGNFTSSSNGSNNLLPPTDSIASLLLNPPHSPECNSGLMATPSDSEGESLDEDLLSTSSSSTLLLPRDKPPPRPPPPVRRKLPRSPVLEEEIIDGFAILEFKTYEDLEFAIKLGQKRKEKRLSALEELTCTYSIEEMKIPKVIDTGQSSHPMRCVSSLSTLSIVGNTNNNSLKEVSSQPPSRHNPGNISSNGPAALNSKNDSVSNANNVVYMLPSAALETEAEPRAHWRSEYGQQQQQQPAQQQQAQQTQQLLQQEQQQQQQQQCDKSKNNVISNDVQIKNNHQIISQIGNKNTDVAATIEPSSDTSFLENNGHDTDSLMLDITLTPALGGAAAAATGEHMDVGPINVNNKSHNSIPKSNSSSSSGSNSNDQTKSLPQLQLNSLISRDLAAGVVGMHNNHLMSVGCKAATASEHTTVKKLNSLENMEIGTPSAAVCRSMDVQELANGSAQVVGASGSGSNSSGSSAKKGNGEPSDLLNDNTEKMFDIMDYPTTTTTSSMHISNNASSVQDRSAAAAAAAELPHFKGIMSLAATGDNNNVTFSGVPSFSTPTSTLPAPAASGLEPDAMKSTTTALIESAQANVAAVSTKAEGESGKREPPGSILQKSTADKPLLYPAALGSSAVTTQFTGAGILPFGNDKNVVSVSVPSAADGDQKVAFGATKAAASSVSNGLSSGGSGGGPRPLVPQSPIAVTTPSPSPFSARGLATSSVILASSNTRTSSSGSEASTVATEIAKNQNTVLATSSSSSSSSTTTSTAASGNAALVNGFLSGYPPATSTTVIASNTLPRASPTHNNNKLMSPAAAAAAVAGGPPGAVSTAAPTAVSGMGKMMFGSGNTAAAAGSSPLLFSGAGQPMPMLIQAPPPYRTPYANYPLFTPYSSLTTHGSYLPPVLPIVATPNIPPPPSPSHHIRSSELGRSSSRESPSAAGLMKAASQSVLQNVSMAAPPAMLRSMTPISSGSTSSSSSTSQPVASVVTTSSAGSFLSSTATLPPSHSHNILSHSHNMPVYGSSSSAATAAAAAAAAAASSQSLPPPISNQILAQPGNFSSLSHHLLTTHPAAAAAAAAQQQQQQQQQQQHQPIVRYSSSSSASVAGAAAASNFNSPSILTVQSLTTAVTSSSSLSSLSTTSSSSSSSSVIQKIISPKGESPSNKDRDSSHGNPSMRSSHVAPTLLPVVSSQGIGVGSAGPFCGIASSQYGGTPVLPSNASMMTSMGMGMGSLSAYPSKAALWLNSPANGMVTSCAASSAPIVSSGSSSTRPTPPLLNCTPGMGMGIGMGAAGLSAARSSCNTISPHPSIPSAANPSPYFPASMPQPQSSPSPAAISSASSSASQMPIVSHAMSSIVTTAAVTTPTTSSASSMVQQPAVASSASTSTSAHPFSAESLFQPSKNDQADLLRRELDSRFLDRSGLSVAAPTPPSSTYLRPPDLQQPQQQPPPPPPPHHHHQHQHTHLHQHQQLLPPPPTSASAASTVQPNPGQIFPPPLFKDISKMSGVDPQFYRTPGGMGLPTGGGYAGYAATGLLHSGLGGPTPFMPPNHLTSFAPKKTGRWNAMHVRIAWEIYYHQNKQSSDKSGGCPPASSSLLGNNSSSVNPASSAINAPIAAGNLLSSGGGGSVSGGASTPVNNVATGPAVGSGVGVGGGGVVVPNGQASASAIGIKTTPALSINTTPQHLLHRANEMPPAAAFASALPGRSPFEASPLAASFIGAPPSHIGTAVSQFGRYVTPFGFTGLTHFGGHLDSWRTNAMQRSVAYHPSSALASPNWPIKADPGLDNARREAEERERELREREQRERDRQRREREERERKEKEEKLKREHQERERERERDRKERERERREIERREMERERLLQQQRINESNKQAAAAQAAAAAASAAPVRDRSPHRNVGELNTEIRIKEEHPRPTKDEQDVMLMRASAAAVAVGGDPRYHSSSLAAAQANAAAAAAHHHHHANFMAASRHGLAPPPPSHLARTMMPPTLSVGGPITHFSAPAPPGWGIDPYRDPYPILRYNPIMEAALRHEAEERQKAINIYAAQSAAHLRGKEPSPIPPPPVGVGVGALGPPPPHHRLQIVSPQSQPQQQQPQQLQQPAGKANTGPSSGTGAPPPPIVGIPVQHMMSVDALSQQQQQQQQQQQGVVNTKKESVDHTASMGGLVVGGAAGGGGGGVGGGGGGLSTVVPGGVIGISPVSSVAPSR
ncbi:hypothetical protein KR032_005188, partial [Drosophila birchii]